MIYLAGPYSHKIEAVRVERFEALTKKAAELMNDGFTVYSPITHGHAIAERHDLPLDFEWWSNQCLDMLSRATTLVVLRLDGYAESVGVSAEIEHAERLKIKIEFINP